MTIPMMKNMRIIIPPLGIQNTYAERIATTEIEKELIKNLYRNPKRYSTAGWNSGLTDTRIWKTQVHQCGQRG